MKTILFAVAVTGAVSLASPIHESIRERCVFDPSSCGAHRCIG